jgi:hypothetical protein
MGKIIDSNALYNIGKSMTADVRDNRARDAAMAFVGVKALQLIGNAFATRQNARRKGAQTISNAKNEITESDYDTHVQNIATDEVNGHKQLLNKAANLEAIGKVQQAVELRNQVDGELKRLKQGADFIKSKGDILKQMYEKGTFTTSKGDMKVAVNPASSAMSQQHGASFADGSIYQSFDFREYDGKKQWVLVGEEQVTNQISKPTYTPLSELEMPELNEKKIINDYNAGLGADFEKLGYRDKDGDFNKHEKVTRDNVFNNVNEMTSNQISSYWYSPSGDDLNAPILKYVTQPNGFMLDGKKQTPILDPNEQGISSEEIEKRQLIASGVLEELKKEDWTSHEKVSWLVDNEIMPGARDAFQRGFNNQPEKVTKTPKGKEGQALLDGQQYLTIAQARATANKMSQKGDISYSRNQARRYINKGNGIIELSYLDKNTAKYVASTEVPLDEALSMRGIGSNFTGLNFETKKPEGFKTKFVNDGSDKTLNLYNTYFGPNKKGDVKDFLSEPVDFGTPKP